MPTICPRGHVLTSEAPRAGVAQGKNAELAVTWIGHATTLIRLGDQWALTDPVLTDDIGLEPIRVEQLVPPRPGIADLPPIDIIVISHADYDHLDIPSLRRLARRRTRRSMFRWGPRRSSVSRASGMSTSSIGSSPPAMVA